jgi:hypothetical protein
MGVGAKKIFRDDRHQACNVDFPWSEKVDLMFLPFSYRIRNMSRHVDNRWNSRVDLQVVHEMLLCSFASAVSLALESIYFLCVRRLLQRMRPGGEGGGMIVIFLIFERFQRIFFK